MRPHPHVTRRTFLITVGKAFPITIGGLYLVSCGDDKSTNPSEMLITAQSTVNAGHSHSAGFPESDLDSMQDRSYSSSLSSGHRHTVTLTKTDFEALRTSGSVTVTSSNDSGHAHDFTFRT